MAAYLLWRREYGFPLFDCIVYFCLGYDGQHVNRTVGYH